MKKFIRRTGLLLLVALVVIQFFQTEKNSNPTSEALVNDINNKYPLPADVQDILQTSCYDCHSNNTIYPWYDNIQPVSWWLHHHIEEGKRELNFNEFLTYSPRRQFKKFKEINEQVKENEMPLASYTLVHKDATLNEEQKMVILKWVSAAMDSMKANYPADSLVIKKQ